MLGSILSRVFLPLLRGKLPGLSRGKKTGLGNVFSLFKKVLESNNRALEAITDMGEKLGGAYIFDINYIKQSYSVLSSGLRESIGQFNSLTGNAYPIGAAFERIDSLIGRMIYGAPAGGGGEMVLFYEDITWDMLRETGGKNFHLSEIKNAMKLNVPDAFAITGHAFDEFIRHNGLEKKIEALSEGGAEEEKLRELRELVLGGGFPAPLDAAIGSAVEKMKARNFSPRNKISLAVRSSAEEEDSEFYSFAGQFETVLNVRAEKTAVEEAYKKVVSSLFSEEAAAYRKGMGITGAARMPVGCVMMVDAAASGVLYTADPLGVRKNAMIVNAAWGLGKSVVEGSTGTDLFVIGRGEGGEKPEIAEVKTGEKAAMTVASPEGGTKQIETPPGLEREKPCLSGQQVLELAGVALRVENHYRRPQDIEWSFGKDGRLYILQTRPLKVSGREDEREKALRPGGKMNPVLMSGRGFVVQRGTAAGPAFILERPGQMDEIPRGAVLVAKNDSPQFIRVMPFISAIITDTGAPASHMASICREFRIPAVVNTGNATQVFSSGQELTLLAGEDGGMTVYAGIVRELVEGGRRGLAEVEDLYEFRKKRYLMRYIAPLNLVNPLTDDFTPEKCKTMHDIIRFIHEKSVQELISASREAGGHSALRRLDLPVPAGIQVIDIGGGLAPDAKDPVRMEQVTSVPFEALLKGMTQPGVWHAEAVSLQMKDFLASMMRMPDITAEGAGYAGRNIAVISGEYLNLTLRFGYHFNLLDCFCSDRPGNNHIYFRFVGGATDITKRSRRIQLIADVLKEYGFVSSTKGDLITARLSNVGREEIVRILEQAGRLIAFTRQLDAVLADDASVEKYRDRFFRGEFRF
ncbi:MAG: PEP-utilizing enzyme [Nitrospiraceae bacterium]|nr:PEP-utilizing enzyme [Nitrospiraceae bacterium]